MSPWHLPNPFIRRLSSSSVLDQDYPPGPSQVQNKCRKLIRHSNLNAGFYQRVAYIDPFVLILYVENPAVDSLGADDVRHHIPLNLLNRAALCHCEDLIERSFATPVNFVIRRSSGISSAEGSVAEFCVDLALCPAVSVRLAGSETGCGSFSFGRFWESLLFFQHQADVRTEAAGDGQQHGQRCHQDNRLYGFFGCHIHPYRLWEQQFRCFAQLCC